MGIKTWMLVGSSGSARELLAAQSALDRDATRRLAARLFPKERLEALGEDGDLAYTSPPDDEIHIGCFPGVWVVAAKEFGIDRPSTLDPRFLQEANIVHLHAMHSVVDWFAFAVWRDGQLQRSLSVSPDSGVMEDLGGRLPFELPYWAGEHPYDDEFEDADESSDLLPFHPLELGDAALLEFFGYQFEGELGASLFEPDNVPLMRFKRKRSWFRFW